MRALVYTRQSSDRSGNALAVERQRDLCEQLCVDRGWTVVRVITDNDMSASTGKPRPGYQRVLEAIDAATVDVVAVYHVDRLVRRLGDLEDVIERCERSGVRLATVQGDIDLSTDSGRLIGRILASVARGEVERKSTRQRDAQAQAAKAGRRVGGRRPFGYDVDGLTIRDDEARAIRDGYDGILSGVPLRAIARDWNGRGLRTGQRNRTTGEPSPWRADSVRSVLTNPRYVGLRRYKGEIVGPAVWPALVAEDVYQAAVAVLRDPARSNPGTLGRALLTGLALCGTCGATVHGGRNNLGQRSYRCKANDGHVSRQAKPVEDYVSDVMIERLGRPDAAELLTDHERPDVDALRTEANALRARLEEVAAVFADGGISASQLRTATTKIRGQLTAIESTMADAGRVDILGPLIGADDVRATWEGLGVDRQRAVINTLATVTLFGPGRGARTFRPDTVLIAPH